MRDYEFPWEKEPSPDKLHLYRDIKNERKPWDQFWMDLADQVGRQSTCWKKAVGCVITKNNRLLSVGFNGFPSGLDHPKSCVRIEKGQSQGEYGGSMTCPCTHSEINAIIYCARFGVPTENSTIYVRYFPCLFCVSALANAKVTEIVYVEPAVDDLSMPIAMECGIKCRRLKQ